jgi:hypothetical protein
LFQFLTKAQELTPPDSPKFCQSSVFDDIIGKMSDISLLPFVDDENSSENVSIEAEVTLPLLEEQQIFDFVHDSHKSNLILEDTLFFMDYDGKVTVDVADILRQASAFAWGVNVESGSLKIHAKGRVSINEFMSAVREKNHRLPSVIIYAQGTANIQFDSGLVLGAKLNSKTLTSPTETSFVLKPRAADDLESDSFAIWKSINSHFETFGAIGDTFGTIGCLLKVSFDGRTMDVVQTAAHVPFSRLNMGDLSCGQMTAFNEQVQFAHYSQKHDICFLPAAMHTCDNGLFKPQDGNDKYKLWNSDALYPGCMVIKVGAKTRVTTGKFKAFYDTIQINGNEYQELFEVESDFDKFSDHGDSGAVYFTVNELGFIPFAIHRCSDDDGRLGYGCVFSRALDALQKKVHFSDIKFA